MARCRGLWRTTPSIVAAIILLGLAQAPARADDDAKLVADLRGTHERLLETGGNLHALLNNPGRTDDQVLVAQRKLVQDVTLLQGDLGRVRNARAARRPISSEAAAIVAQCVSLCKELKELQRALSGHITPDLGASAGSIVEEELEDAFQRRIPGPGRGTHEFKRQVTTALDRHLKSGLLAPEVEDRMRKELMAGIEKLVRDAFAKEAEFIRRMDAETAPREVRQRVGNAVIEHLECLEIRVTDDGIEVHVRGKQLSKATLDDVRDRGFVDRAGGLLGAYASYWRAKLSAVLGRRPRLSPPTDPVSAVDGWLGEARTGLHVTRNIVSDLDEAGRATEAADLKAQRDLLLKAVGAVLDAYWDKISDPKAKKREDEDYEAITKLREDVEGQVWHGGGGGDSPRPSDEDEGLTLALGTYVGSGGGDLDGVRITLVRTTGGGYAARLPDGSNLFDDAIKQPGLDMLATTIRRVSSDGTTTTQPGHIEFDEAEVFTLHITAADRRGGYTAGKAVFRREE